MTATFTPLPYTNPDQLLMAWRNGERFVLHYHGRVFDVRRMAPHKGVVFVNGPSLAVKIKPDGSNAEGTSPDIWLEKMQ